MEFGDDFATKTEEVDPAAEFLAREQSVLGDLESEIIPNAANTIASEVELIDGEINNKELAPAASGGLESSTGSFELIGVDQYLITEKKRKHEDNFKRTDYLIWNDYFMATAQLAAKRSKDPVTQVGACLVDKKKRIVAIGYNGFPRNCNDDAFPWCKKRDLPEGADQYEIKNMYVVHAEANAILNKNTSSLQDTTLYTTLFPCNECAKLIIQSDIKNILYMSNKLGHKPSYRASKRMFDAAGVSYSQYKPTIQTITIDFSESMS